MDYEAAKLFCREHNTTLLSYHKAHWKPGMLSSIETLLGILKRLTTFKIVSFEVFLLQILTRNIGCTV